MKLETITGRIWRGQKTLLDKFAKEERTDRSMILRQALELGLNEMRIEKAVESFQKEKATLWKAAQLAGLSLWEFMDIIRERKIPIHYTKEDLEEDLEALRE